MMSFPMTSSRSAASTRFLRQLAEHGLQPFRILQAATLNAAPRLGPFDLGLDAPGRRADLVLFRDLVEFEAVHVFCDGRPPEFREDGAVALLPAAELGRPLVPGDFDITARGPCARVSTIDEPRFTRWAESRMKVHSGVIALPDDVLRMTVIHRHRQSGVAPRTGFLTGWGYWRGAFAATVSHDSHNVTVFGSRTTDMAVAANAVIEAGGGMAVAASGEVHACVALPVAGLVSDAPLEEVAAGFTAVRSAMDGVAGWKPPNRVFKALVGASLACNPGPRLTDLGIADPHAGVLRSSPVIEDDLPDGF